ncbi:uncharacterized protein N7511_009635 [Penicillium nucicola]|uniref:uncharacterized protein n=1 Tax=Penicillium nucicola TaxID=1850975 RepID=UPI0025450330|nr:uncharacterized protein N7511_009635 [Penicillium nucicola]KAJ5747939.1 hypothetical protein N7511_009635 [Penicillium nucicola]
MLLMTSSRAITRRLVQTARFNPLKLVVVPATGLRPSQSGRERAIEKIPFHHTFYQPSLTRKFHSSPIVMANPSELKQTLTPALLDEVHALWFDHLESKDALVLPKMSDMGRWFKQDSEFDKLCVANFRPALETIVNSGASDSDIIAAVNPASPMDWINMILLLDQMPRNCFRGDESRLVFQTFDPLAEKIALKALKANIPTQSSYFRYRLAYRTWFHLPLMHSEDLAVHEKAVQVHADTAKDMEEFVARDTLTLSEEEKECHDILINQVDHLRNFLKVNDEFEKKHKVIIDQFGRYPHRNQALGRISTPEEIQYLENGGETFS